jgi:hypothetical protein
MQTLYTPCARVVVRDCEWAIRREGHGDDGGYILTVDDLPELVSGKSAQALRKSASLSKPSGNPHDFPTVDIFKHV